MIHSATLFGLTTDPPFYNGMRDLAATVALLG
jgi:hypothetical protein